MSWLTPLPAAPKANPFEVAGEYFNRPMGDRIEGGWWLAAVATISLLWAAIYLIDRRRRQAERDGLSPTSLWEQLCLAHELTTEERALLRRFAGADEVEACKIFVDPRRWRNLPSQAADRLMLESIQTRLFGSLGMLERAG